MAITNILRDWASSVSIVRIMDNSTLATISAAGYLNTQIDNIERINSGTFAWVPSDFILAYASDGWGLFTISSDFSSLNPFMEAGTGTVTEVDTGTGLTGGPITDSGTISLANIGTLRILSNITGGTAAPIPNTLTSIIDAAIGSTQGDILYRSATAWSVLAPGTSGNFLQTQGASANPQWAAAGGSGITRVLDSVITTTSNFTPDATMLYTEFEVVGGGGGGGGSQGGVSGAAGGENGAGGGFSRGCYTRSQILGAGAFAVVNIGARGNGASTGNNNGGNGGTTNVVANEGGGATLIQATGGTGGNGCANQTGTFFNISDGAGGIGSLGSLNVQGDYCVGSLVLGTLGFAFATQGGNSMFGPGAAPNQGGGNNCGTFGGGGGGATSTTVDAGGGLGGPGVCFARQYCS